MLLKIALNYKFVSEFCNWVGPQLRNWCIFTMFHCLVPFLKLELLYLSTRLSWLTTEISFLTPRLSWLTTKISFLIPRLFWLTTNISFLIPRLSFLTPRLSFLTPRLSWLTPRLSWLTTKISFLGYLALHESKHVYGHNQHNYIYLTTMTTMDCIRISPWTH